MENKDYAPIIVFAYNRLNELMLTIEALKRNVGADKSDLFIFIDGPKNDFGKEINEKIYDFCLQITGFNNIFVENSDHNRGLANNVIYGVTKIMKEYGKAIVVEDDIITSNMFLSFMNSCLEYYKEDLNIWSIGGYAPNVKFPRQNEVYFSQRTESWGWASWNDRWIKVDWNVTNYNAFISDKKKIACFNLGGKDLTPMLTMQREGKINSWSIRFDFAAYENKGFTVHSPLSLTENIGCNSSGTNFQSENSYFDTTLRNNYIPNLIPFNMDRKCQKIASKYYHPSIVRRIVNKIKKILGIK